MYGRNFKPKIFTDITMPAKLFVDQILVSGWFGGIAERPTRTILPPEDRVDLRYLLSNTRNVLTSCLRPCGRLTVRHAVGGMGREDGRSEGHPVMGWIWVETLPGP